MKILLTLLSLISFSFYAHSENTTVKAPFGLSWGMSFEEAKRLTKLKSAGKLELDSQKIAKQYRTKELPENSQHAHEYILRFVENHGLVSITMASDSKKYKKQFKKLKGVELFKSMAQEQSNDYQTLNGFLTKKYGEHKNQKALGSCNKTNLYFECFLKSPEEYPSLMWLIDNPDYKLGQTQIILELESLDDEEGRVSLTYWSPVYSHHLNANEMNAL